MFPSSTTPWCGINIRPDHDLDAAVEVFQCRFDKCFLLFGNQVRNRRHHSGHEHCLPGHFGVNLAAQYGILGGNLISESAERMLG